MEQALKELKRLGGSIWNRHYGNAQHVNKTT